MLRLPRLAGCSFAPAYHPPRHHVTPVAFKEAGPLDTGDRPPTSCSRAANGGRFTAIRRSVQPRAAHRHRQPDARRRARPLRRSSQPTSRKRAQGLFPHIGLETLMSRATASPTTAPLRAAKPAQLTTPPTPIDGDVGYELDLWGRVRNSSKAAGKGRSAGKPGRPGRYETQPRGRARHQLSDAARL